MNGKKMSAPGYANAAQPMLGQLQGLANQAFNQAYSQYQQNQPASGSHSAQMAAQQQALYNQYAQGMFNQMAATKPFRLAGVDMTFDEFLEEVAPDDGPMRTFLTLKYKGRDDSTKKNI